MGHTDQFVLVFYSKSKTLLTWDIMNIFYVVSIYTNKHKYYLNTRLTLTIVTSFIAIIAEVGYP